jgi:hypothetical protein
MFLMSRKVRVDTVAGRAGQSALFLSSGVTQTTGGSFRIESVDGSKFLQNVSNYLSLYHAEDLTVHGKS